MDAPATCFQPDAENTRLLRDAFGRFATGVTVVTTMSEDGPVGITANSFTSVSLDPPLVLWAPSIASRRFPYFDQAEHYAIHVLAANQDDRCWEFANDAHALKSTPHTFNPEGVPVLADTLARFECKRTARYDGGDHKLILGKVLRAEMRDGDALVFFGGQHGTFTQK